MDKKIFSRSLYVEALHQIKVTAIIHFVLVCIQSVIIPSAIALLAFLNHTNAGEMQFYYLNSSLTYTVYLFTPLYTLFLFGFMNKRNRSDFYHAIPYTRSCIFVSFSAAIVSVILSITLISTAITAVLSILYQSFFTLSISSIFPFVLNMLSACLLVMSAMLIAMSISGTYFSNIVLSIIILFLPRIFISAYSAMFYWITQILPSSHGFILMNANVNNAVGFLNIFSLINQSGISPYSSWISFAYTVCLAAIYYFVAFCLFKIRPSETSSKAASTQIIQAIGRIAFTTFICLPANFLLISAIINQSSEPEVMVVFAAIVYIFAIIGFFLYEMILTRQPKNLVKALPSLIVIVFIQLAIYGGLFGARELVLWFNPDKSNVTSFSLITETTDTFWGDDYQYYRDTEQAYNYFMTQMNTIEIKDEKAIEIIANNLDSNIDRVRHGMSNQTFSAGQGYIFKINTKFGSRYRYIYISDNDFNQIIKALGKTDKVSEIIKTYPEANDSLTVESTRNDLKLSAEQKKEIYDLYINEISKCDLTKINELYNTYYFDDESNPCAGYISLTTKLNGKEYYLSFPITLSLTPHTYNEVTANYNYSYRNEMIKNYKNGVFIKLSKGEDTVESESVNNSSYPYCYNKYEEIVFNVKPEVLQKQFNDSSINEDSNAYICLETQQDCNKFADYLTSVINEQVDYEVGFITIYENLQNTIDGGVYYDSTDEPTKNYCYTFPIDFKLLPKELIKFSNVLDE